MADLTLTRASVAVLDDLALLAIRDSIDLWRLAQTDDATQVVRLLADQAPAITETYGTVAADLGADLYDETRAAARQRTPYRATPTTPVPGSQVEAMTRWSVGPLFSATPDGALALAQFASGIDRLVRLPYRKTLLENTGADPAAVGAVRVASPGACSFCLMLASRGVEHVNAQGETSQDRWHRNCKCAAVPSYGPGFDDMPDPEDLLSEWFEVTEGAGSSADQRNAWRRHVNAKT